MHKKSRQRFKYFENRKSFLDEIKSIFHHVWRTNIEVNRGNFFESLILRTSFLSKTGLVDRWLVWKKNLFYHFSPRHWNTGLVSSGATLTSWGKGASLALVGNPSSDGVTIKMPYGVDALHQPASHPIFFYWFSWNWIWLYCCISSDWLREMNAGGSCDYCWCLFFFGFLRPDLSPWGYGNRCFLVALQRLVVRRPKLKVPTKRLLLEQVKLSG